MQNLTLKFFHPPSQEGENWHFQKANIENIRKAIGQFLWIMRFKNIDVNKKVNLFNKTIKKYH